MSRADVEGLLDLLRSRKQTLATAESCTGGMLGATITEVAGASDVYVGGYITYADRLKSSILGLTEKDLATHGSVSGATVEEMADQARQRCNSDMAIAISGIAGPSGGTTRKPVGTVWLAVLGPADLMDIKRHVFEGSRQAIRQQAVEQALATAVALVQEADLEQA